MTWVALTMRLQKVSDLPIAKSTLSRWGHHRSATASVQTHLAIREALAAYAWPKDIIYDTFLQGSYKNSTNLRQDSDVDVVVQLSARLRPRVAALEGAQLLADASHKAVYARWHSFRDHALRAMRARFGDSVSSGRKTLKLARGVVQASADLVVTVKSQGGVAFYLPNERRWVVSYPQHHYQRGLKKEEATSQRFKRTIRVFKAARNRLVEHGVLTKDDAPSYFIECLLYNVPSDKFTQDLTSRFEGILGWLKEANLVGFKCQNGKVALFGQIPEQWNVDDARRFIGAMEGLWNNWH